MWGMDHAHHVLNNLVLPNVVEFVVSLPWRLLLVVFPMLPAPSSSSARPITSKKNGGKGPKPPGLAARLQHLKMPTTTTTKKDRSSEHLPGVGKSRSPRTGAAAAATSPPPLPPRTPPSQLPETASCSDGIDAHNSVASLGRPGSKHKEENGDSNINSGLHAKSPVGFAAGTAVLDDDYSDGTLATPSLFMPGTALPEDDYSAGLLATPARDSGVSLDTPSKSDNPEGRESSPRRRRSIGEIVRSAITGDGKVRVRDHLFDLNTATPHPPPAARVPDTTEALSAGAAVSISERQKSSGSTSTGKSEEKRETTKHKQARNVGGDAGGRARDHVREKTVVAASSAASSARLRYPTRRRPSEFSQVAVGGESMGSKGGGRSGSGGGGGDAAGGTIDGLTQGSNLRHRGGSAGRKPTDRRTDSPTLDTNISPKARVKTSLRGSGVSSGGGARGGAITSAESRAARLLEWRRKREEQVLAQEKEKVRRKRGAVGSTAAGHARVGSGTALPKLLGPRDEGSGGGVRTRSAAAPGRGSSDSRRFRHVERFRTEMARAPVPTIQEPDSSGTSTRLASPTARTKRSR